LQSLAKLAGSSRPGSEQRQRCKANPTLEVEAEGLAEVAGDVLAGCLGCVDADVVLTLRLQQQSQSRLLRRHHHLPHESP
jgi:hypothetical protein